MPPAAKDVPGLQNVPLGELGTDPWGATSGKGTKNVVPGAPAKTIAPQAPTLDPLRHADAWTYVLADGQRSPGMVPLGGFSGFDREEKWDVKEGKGTQGASTTHVAMSPAKGSFTFRLYTVEHHAAWDAWLAGWRFDASKKTSTARTTYYPALASVQPPIVNCVMTKHTPVKPVAGGWSEVTIDLLEHFPAKPQAATTAAGAKGYTTGKGKGNGTQTDPAIVALQAQVQRLMQQAQEAA